MSDSFVNTADFDEGAEGDGPVSGGALGIETGGVFPPGSEALVDEFRDFFAQINAKHFNADEFLFLGNSHHGTGACAGRNEVAPKELWPNLPPLVRALDELRARLGAPVRLTNVYRGPSYNRCVGGVTRSQHLQFRAADLVALDGKRTAHWAAVARRVRSDGVFSGGVGVYGSFIHIDTRGSVADWDFS